MPILIEAAAAGFVCIILATRFVAQFWYVGHDPIPIVADSCINAWIIRIGASLSKANDSNERRNLVGDP